MYNQSNEQIDFLIQTFRTGKWEISRKSADTLIKLGNSTTLLLIAALKDENNYARRWSAAVLGEIGDTRAVEPLIETLEDQDNEVRLWTIEALGDFNHIRVINSLIQLLKEQNQDIFETTTNALKNIGELAFIHLLDTFRNKSEDATLRCMIATALTKFEDKRVIEPFVEALEDSDEEIRRSARYSLAKFIPIADTYKSKYIL